MKEKIKAYLRKQAFAEEAQQGGAELASMAAKGNPLALAILGAAGGGLYGGALGLTNTGWHGLMQKAYGHPVNWGLGLGKGLKYGAGLGAAAGGLAGLATGLR